MSTLTSYITGKSEQELVTGEVVKKVAFKKYQVQIGDKTLNCKSSEDIPTGSRVIVAFSEKEHIILKQIGRRNRSVVEVVIDG